MAAYAPGRHQVPGLEPDSRVARSTCPTCGPRRRRWRTTTSAPPTWPACPSAPP